MISMSGDAPRNASYKVAGNASAPTMMLFNPANAGRSSGIPARLERYEGVLTRNSTPYFSIRSRMESGLRCSASVQITRCLPVQSGRKVSRTDASKETEQEARQVPLPA